MPSTHPPQALHPAPTAASACATTGDTTSPYTPAATEPTEPTEAPDGVTATPEPTEAPDSVTATPEPATFSAACSATGEAAVQAKATSPHTPTAPELAATAPTEAADSVIATPDPATFSAACSATVEAAVQAKATSPHTPTALEPTAAAPTEVTDSLTATPDPTIFSAACSATGEAAVHAKAASPHTPAAPELAATAPTEAPDSVTTAPEPATFSAACSATEEAARTEAAFTACVDTGDIAPAATSAVPPPTSTAMPHDQALPPLQGGELLLHRILALLAYLPLWVWRGLGAGIGVLLFALLGRRRHIALVNVALCLPQFSTGQRRRLVLRHFVRQAQAALDRIWLWHGSEALLHRRLHMRGDVQQLSGDAPLVLFAPHFVGLDAGGMALCSQYPQRRFISIYTPQRSAAADMWSRRGRTRFANAVVVWRRDGVKPVIRALRERGMLYLLPDMNFGPQESIFVPFFGQPAATVPSLSRFARLGQAQVVSVMTFMERHGYTVHIQGPWSDYPTADATADTARMNLHLQDWIMQRPDEYFWVHQRFKTRPAGYPPVY